MKLTKKHRDQLDLDVLRMSAQTSTPPTYVLRNMLDWPGEGWHRVGLETSDVLRACRRLEAQGLIEEARSFYAVMKAWSITPAGREALANKGSET